MAEDIEGNVLNFAYEPYKDLTGNNYKEYQ